MKLLKFNQAIENLQKEVRHGMQLQQLLVLNYIYLAGKEGYSFNELQNETGLSAAILEKTLELFFERKLVCFSDPSNHRIGHLSISQRGIEVLDKTYDLFKKALAS